MLRIGRNSKAEPAGQGKIEAEESSPHSGRFVPPPTPSAYYYTEANSTVNQARPLAEKPAAQRAMSESDSLARDIKDGLVSGFVGSGTTLTGEANFKGMLRVDGHLSGHVSSEKGTLIVSAGAQVDADIEVAAAKINGRINGDIFATERIELGRAAEVYGDIETPILVVEQGAIFEGSCRMARPATAAAESHEASITGRERGDDPHHTVADEPAGADDFTPLGNAAS